MQNNKEFWYSDLSSSKKKIAIVDEHSTCQVNIVIKARLLYNPKYSSV